ncbi:hypothetical protein PybrP1_001092 [[Pythium] brassicae (nom. inval.)]|nr:hypothetical protein PybrP1_001092 [[Pythium] brassicae (nom. inval.)]
MDNRRRRDAGASPRAPCRYALELVQTYFCMLTVGCGRERAPDAAAPAPGCSNANCRSSRRSRELSAADAAVRSVYLATLAPAPLCIPIGRYFGSPAAQPPPLAREEERPETDDDDERDARKQQQQHGEEEEEEGGARAPSSTPRRRLSSAVELDFALRHERLPASDDDDDAERELVAPGQRVSARRTLSRPKQKLLDAITKTKSKTSSASSDPVRRAIGR